jgi:hypothetical protein
MKTRINVRKTIPEISEIVFILYVAELEEAKSLSL